MFECQDFAKHMKLLSEGTDSMICRTTLWDALLWKISTCQGKKCLGSNFIDLPGVIGVYLGRVTILDASLRVLYSRPSVFSASVRPSLFAPQSNLLSLPPAHWGWRLSAATRQQFPEAWPFDVSYINGPWLVVDVLCLLTLLECFGKDDTKNLWEQSPIVPRSKASLSYVARFKSVRVQTILAKEHIWPISQQWHEYHYNSDIGTNSMELTGPNFVRPCHVQLRVNLGSQIMGSATPSEWS